MKLRFSNPIRGIKESLLRKAEEYLRSRRGVDPNVIMLAPPPPPKDPLSPKQLQKDFQSLITRAINSRATQVRIQNDKPSGWLQFVVDRAYVQVTTWEHEYATKFFEEAYKATDNRGVPYGPYNSTTVMLERDKFDIDADVNAVWLQFSPLAGSVQQMVAHIVYADERSEAA
jgi:hypothetical protein